MPTDVFVFDAYGTLFDVHSAVRRHAAEIGPEADRLSSTWRTKQLEYTWVRSLMGRYRDFAALTAEALDFALDAVPSVDPSLRPLLLAAYRELEAFSDVRPVLSQLRAGGARIAILSNGTPEMLHAATDAAGIDDLLDDVISVDRIGIYKTAPAVYDLIFSRLGAGLDQVSLQSSNRWDVAGATARGIRAVWVNRTGQLDEYRDLPPAAEIRDLTGLL